jgi:hypothetical protein
MTGYFLKVTQECQGKTLLNESYGIVSAFCDVDNSEGCLLFSRAYRVLHEGFREHGFCFVIVKLDVPDGIFPG